MTNERFFKRVTDSKGRKGFLIEKEKVYRKAWFHRNIARWDPVKHGEVGQNIPSWMLENEDIKFIKINIFDYGRYYLEVEDLLSFYSENKKIRDIIFRTERYLFPISICKKIEK